jgi:hypothetical protein
MKKTLHHRTTHSCFLTTLLVLFSLSALAQKAVPDALEYAGTLTFLDGTPVELSRSEQDEFSITNTEFPNVYAAAVEVEDDSLHITCIRAGMHILRFMDQEVARFEVTAVGGTLQTSLSPQLALPFNYLIQGDPGDRIHIYNHQLVRQESLTIPESGKLGLSRSSADFGDKFIAYERDEQFIIPFTFQEVREKDRGKLSKRQFRTGSSPLRAQQGLVHKLTDDAYYQVQRVFFSDAQSSILVLKTYDQRSRKAALFPIKLEPQSRKGAGGLALDYLGNLIYTLDQQTYRMEKNGAVSPAHDVYLSPIYQFEDHFIKGGYWLTPVFAGLPLPQGSHTFTVVCDGKKGGSKTSSETFQVERDPNPDNLWRMDSPFNTGEEEDYYFPSGIDPAAELHEMDIKECRITVDNYGELVYSYIDETRLRGIHYTEWGFRSAEKAGA